jgi:hypothetical protein
MNSMGQSPARVFCALTPLLTGTYAVVKEAVHISTGKYYACKVINKRLMEGREHMVGLPNLDLT